MFKPITIEEIKNRLVFSHNQVFNLTLKLKEENTIIQETFTFDSSYHIRVMNNISFRFSPVGSQVKSLDDYIFSLEEDNDVEILGFYEYETE